MINKLYLLFLLLGFLGSTLLNADITFSFVESESGTTTLTVSGSCDPSSLTKDDSLSLRGGTVRPIEPYISSGPTSSKSLNIYEIPGNMPEIGSGSKIFSASSGTGDHIAIDNGAIALSTDYSNGAIVSSSTFSHTLNTMGISIQSKTLIGQWSNGNGTYHIYVSASIIPEPTMTVPAVIMLLFVVLFRSRFFSRLY